ncbi:MAG: hypothetical protein ACK5L0_01475 [Candidatus Fimivivens sp.]
MPMDVAKTGGGGMSSGDVMDGIAMEQGGALAQFMDKLPEPVQVLLQIFLVVLIAAVIGLVIGKMYASIKYPDPEKHHIISPKLKVLFICILAACCFWLYTAMTREETTELEPNPGEEQVGVLDSGADLPVGINNGNIGVMLG